MLVPSCARSNGGLRAEGGETARRLGPAQARRATRLHICASGRDMCDDGVRPETFSNNIQKLKDHSFAFI
jgi:hypothetical protein